MALDSEKPWVVIDTNVYISALISTGPSREVLERVYISPFIIEEIRKALKEKFDWNIKTIERFITLIKSKTSSINPETNIHYNRKGR